MFPALRYSAFAFNPREAKDGRPPFLPFALDAAFLAGEVFPLLALPPRRPKIAAASEIARFRSSSGFVILTPGEIYVYWLCQPRLATEAGGLLGMDNSEQSE